MDEFKDIEFVFNNSTVMSAVTETPGKYYPVRDSCEKEGDPEEKCYTTQAMYYETVIPVGDVVSVYISQNGENLFEQSFPISQEYRYYRSDLYCQDDKFVL